MKADNIDEIVRIARIDSRIETLREVAGLARTAQAGAFATALDEWADEIERLTKPRRSEPDDSEAYEPTDPKHPGYHDLMSDLMSGLDD